MYGFLAVLLLVSWWLLIVRAVQSETLAGDRQYWITRPYEWKKLLAAKILFVGVFVNVPLLIADVVLLTRAGFKPVPSFVPGLLWMQVTLVVFLLLPIAALATVTSSIAQSALALLAVGVYIAVTATLAAYIPSASFSTGSDGLQAAVLIVACVATVVWQYARRKTDRSRALLVSAAAAILIIVVATPYRTLVAYEYQQLGPAEPRPVQLALAPEKPSASEVVPDEKRDLEIQIPMRVSGIDDHSFVAVDGMMLTIEAQDGPRWNSGWKSVSQLLFPNQQLLQTHFEVKKSFFEKVKSSAVRAHISFAVTVSRDMSPRRIIATGGDFVVPEVGLCSVDQRFSTSLLCRFPVRGPRLIVVETASSQTTCPTSDDEPVPAGKTAHGWGGNTDSGPFSPVGTFNLYLWAWGGVAEHGSSPRVCPGTPLFFSTPEVVRRIRMEVDLNGFRPADYRLSNSFRFMLGAPATKK